MSLWVTILISFCSGLANKYIWSLSARAINSHVRYLGFCWWYGSLKQFIIAVSKSFRVYPSFVRALNCRSLFPSPLTFFPVICLNREAKSTYIFLSFLSFLGILVCVTPLLLGCSSAVTWLLLGCSSSPSLVWYSSYLQIVMIEYWLLLSIFIFPQSCNF